ncbi:MAG: MBL fold metallo-hydrolase [Leptospiraceae bacterium]|nr:MBL fold metallo-hydrolase [Leptospiraceae bacterium]
MKNFFLRQSFYIFSLVLIVSLSYIGRKPVYGKLKFVLLDTFSHFENISDSLDSNFFRLNLQNTISSDPVTLYSLYSAFGINLFNPDYRFRNHLSYNNYKLNLDTLIQDSYKSNSDCIINLKGFPDTWVPHLTLHWDYNISNTSRLYSYNGYSGKKLAIPIENKFKEKCIVLKDKELAWENGENFRYRSPNLNHTPQQEDIHILQFKKDNLEGAYNILIDVGFLTQTKEKLLDYLAANEIYKIHEIFITHPHKDHYSGLYDLVEFGIPIGKVWMNSPSKKNCDSEIPWGCDFKDLVKLKNLLKQKKIQYEEIYHSNPNEPLTVYKDEHNILSILYASESTHRELGEMNINDLSLIMKLETNGIRYLFTGDLNKNLSNFLKGNSAFQADILKVPHHGTESVASNEFFDNVSPKIGIVPSPQHLWCSERSYRIRNYFTSKKTKMYVSGFHGDILIRHFINKDFQITTEFNPRLVCR